MKIYEIITAEYSNSDRNQRVCAYVASKEIVENYIRANIPEIVNVSKKLSLWESETVWCSTWTEKKFPGFIPDLVYRGIAPDGKNHVCMLFKEIEVIEN
jgi:hypothetical protein